MKSEKRLLEWKFLVVEFGARHALKSHVILIDIAYRETDIKISDTMTLF